MFRKLLGLTSLIAVSAASAAAAAISFSDSVNTTFTPNTLTFTLPLFDPLLGPLTGVTIEYSAEMDGEFTAANQSNADGTLTGTMSGAFTLDGPAPLAMPLLTLNPVGNLGPTAVPAGQQVMFSVLNVMDMDSFTTAVPAELAPFIGPGNFMMNGTAIATAAPIADFNPLLFSASMDGLATVRVTYEYREEVPDVPEPITLYLMGGGLLALGLIRPRSKSSAA